MLERFFLNQLLKVLGLRQLVHVVQFLELAGVKDVLTKSLRGSNPHNVVKATFAALKAFKIG